MTAFWYYHQPNVVSTCADDVSPGISLVAVGADASLVVAGAGASLGVSVGVSLGAAVVAGSW